MILGDLHLITFFAILVWPMLFMVLFLRSDFPLNKNYVATRVRASTTLQNEQNKSHTLLPVIKSIDTSSILFIHIPKAAGTAFTTVLRDIQCRRDPRRYSDCCQNPGSCYIKAFRRCISILGCVSHHPRSHLLGQVSHSVAIFRDPVERVISGWFYTGHNPNSDAFNVRSEFLDIRKNRAPKITFEEYIQYPEYRDIQTRMLGANSFPYRNITVDEQVFAAAIQAVDLLLCVAMQEEFVVSAMLLARIMGQASADMDQRIMRLPMERSNVDTHSIELNHTIGARTNSRERKWHEQSVNGFSLEEKQRIVGNREIVKRVEVLNSFDVRLYSYVQEKFCRQISKFPEVLQLLKSPRCHG